MKQLKILFWIVFAGGIFNWCDAEENVLVENGSKGLHPILLDEFGVVQRKKITLRKLTCSNEVQFQAVTKEGNVKVLFFSSSYQKEVAKFFEGKEEVEFLGLFCETVWVKSGPPSWGEGTTVKDSSRYCLQGQTWNCGQSIYVYELTHPELKVINEPVPLLVVEDILRIEEASGNQQQ